MADRNIKFAPFAVSFVYSLLLLLWGLYGANFLKGNKTLSYREKLALLPPLFVYDYNLFFGIKMRLSVIG